MAKEYPNSRHFLTYQHSLRVVRSSLNDWLNSYILDFFTIIWIHFGQSYASILYLQLPENFRIILRGKDVEHHKIVDDMIPELVHEITYRPKHLTEGVAKNLNVSCFLQFFIYMLWPILTFSFDILMVLAVQADGCKVENGFCKGRKASYWHPGI